jgi:hypothetical protein
VTVFVWVTVLGGAGAAAVEDEAAVVPVLAWLTLPATLATPAEPHVASPSAIRVGRRSRGVGGVRFVRRVRTFIDAIRFLQAWPVLDDDRVQRSVTHRLDQVKVAARLADGVLLGGIA